MDADDNIEQSPTPVRRSSSCTSNCEEGEFLDLIQDSRLILSRTSAALNLYGSAPVPDFDGGALGLDPASLLFTCKGLMLILAHTQKHANDFAELPLIGLSF